MLTASQDSRQQFFELLEHTRTSQAWVKLLLSKYRGVEKDLQRVTIRPISLRNDTVLSFVYSYKTCDITKNFPPAEGLGIVHNLLESDFKNALLFSDREEVQLEISKRGNAILHKRLLPTVAATSSAHDRTKRRFVDITQPFLSVLGITDKRHKLIPAMAGKWKQINKFIEIFSQAISSSGLQPDRPLTIVDFGSGKGYLTFAIHNYLYNVLHNDAHITGIELRETLVDLCNATALTLKDQGLSFVCGDVKTHAPQRCDIMVALHACDTATDYAIHYGIRAQASIIMCSPCCHKQIRPQLRSPSHLKPILQYGVHLGQEADMVTDTLRALLLEANGYSTKVFEFVSTEHTDKNKMILAVKRSTREDNIEGRQEALEQVLAIKNFYAVREHCLETLLDDEKEGVNDLSPEEARKKREDFLTLMRETTRPDDGSFNEIDSADSTMATLILPGG